MSKFTEAADLLKRQAVKYEQFVSAAEILDKFGALENASDELNKQAEAARTAADTAQSRLDEVNANIEKAKEMQNLIISSTTSQANDIEAQAHKDAESLIAQAKDKAVSIIANAEAMASKATNDAAAEIAGMQDARSTLIADIETLTEQAKASASAASDAQSRLDAIKAQINKLATA